MDNSTNWDEIDRFIGGELDDDGLRAFKARMAAEPEFAELVHRQQFLKGMVANRSKLEFQKLLEEVRVENQPFRSYRRWWTAAAAALLILIVSLVMTMRGRREDLPVKPVQNAAIAQKVEEWSFEDPSVSLVSMGNDQSSLPAAETLFKQGQYAEAIVIFEQYLQEDPQNHVLWLYSGVAKMRLKQYEEAIAAFRKITEGGGLDSHIAFWYASLCYYKLGNFPQCKSTLEELLSEGNSPNATLKAKASRLLNSL